MTRGQSDGKKRRLILLWLACVVFALIGAGVFLHLSQLDHELAQVRGDGIVALELAWQPGTAKAIVEAWRGGAVIELARESLYWDFLFIFAYVFFLSAVAGLAWGPMKDEGKSNWLLKVFSGLPGVAGLFDVGENVLLLSMLVAPSEGLGPLLAPWATGLAYAKFGWLLAYGVLGVYLAQPALRTLTRVQFSLLMLVVGVAVLMVPQWQELLRAMTENVSDGALRETQHTRAMALAAASLFAALTTWYSARLLFMMRLDENRATESIAAFRVWLARILGGAVPVLAGVGFFVAAPANQYASVVMPVVYQALALALFVLAVWSYPRLFGEPGDASLVDCAADWTELKTTYPKILGVLRVVIGLNLLLFTGFWYYPWAADWVGAAALVPLAVALIIPVGSILVYWGIRYRYPSLIVLFLLAVVFSLSNDNHSVRLCADMDSTDRECRDADDRPIPRSAVGPFSATPGIDAFLGAWVDSRPHGAAPLPVFIVSAEGGGIRAAYWTAHVLASLQDAARAEGLDFAGHVLAVSGVSGGSLGGAAFAASVRLLGEKCKADDCYARLAHGVLGEDFLSPTVATLLFPDLFNRFLPAPMFNDRAVILERSWERAWNQAADSREGQFEQPFDQLWRGDDGRPDYAVPLLLLNSTVVETGQRLILTPLQLENDGLEFKQVFRDAVDGRQVVGNRLPLSTAAHLSARFTYVSPAGKVFVTGDGEGGSPRWMRLVDGGYFENSGTVTAIELLDALQGFARRSGVRLAPFHVHISNDPVSSVEDQTMQGLSTQPIMGEILSPLRALLNVRPARGYQAREFLRERMDDVYGKGRRQVHFRLHKRDLDLPLGWALSRAVQREIEGQLLPREDVTASAPADNQQAMASVLAHLRGAGSREGASQ